MSDVLSYSPASPCSKVFLFLPQAPGFWTLRNTCSFPGLTDAAFHSLTNFYWYYTSQLQSHWGQKKLLLFSLCVATWTHHHSSKATPDTHSARTSEQIFLAILYTLHVSWHAALIYNFGINSERNKAIIFINTECPLCSRTTKPHGT